MDSENSRQISRRRLLPAQTKRIRISDCSLRRNSLVGLIIIGTNTANHSPIGTNTSSCISERHSFDSIAELA